MISQRLMTLTLSDGRRITVPVINFFMTDTPTQEGHRVDWSAEPDIDTWIGMLAPRLHACSPERSPVTVTRDLQAFVAGTSDAWVVLSEVYAMPRDHARRTAAMNEAGRLMGLQLWLDEVGA